MCVCEGEREKGRWVAGLCVHVCAFACAYICVCLCMHLRSSLWQVVEGVLICHLALQVKLENAGQLRGRGINNTKGPERKRGIEREGERERERERHRMQEISLIGSRMQSNPTNI